MGQICHLVPIVILLGLAPSVFSAERPVLPSADAARLAGPWAAAQARNAQRLCLDPLDKTEFILDDVALKQHRKFAEYSGDISGRWIGAAAFLAPQFPKEFARLPAVMAGFPACQKADGHFGADQELPRIDRHRDMPILWGNGRLLIGLVEVYDRTGDAQALTMAKKLGDYFVATDSTYNKAENLNSVGGSYADGFVTCYFSCIEGLAGLGRVTGDKRYVKEAARIGELAISVSDFEGIHSHGRLCAVRGFADLYALTGKNQWREAAERDWKIFTDRYVMPSGGIKEVLEPKCTRDEGCADSDWLRLNLSLWQLTGEGRYLDAAERSVKNHFIYQQFPNGGAGHRIFQLIDGQPVAFKGLSEEAWWCCGEHWARAMVDVARSAITGGKNGLSINLAIDCDSTVAGPGGNWKAAVRETGDGLLINVEPGKTVKAEVRIHRPAWAQEGRVEAPKGFAVRTVKDNWIVRGNWSGNQMVRVFWPVTLRTVDTGADSGILLRGHDLLVAHRIPANAWLTDKLPTVRPAVLWCAALRNADGRVIVPASLSPNANPDQPEQWHALELAPLRSQAATPDHQTAWFSFQLRPASPEQVAALLGKAKQVGRP